MVPFLLAVCENVSAQDGHYWSENYGNRSMLLSGTVNASVSDLGAVFYNPGRLGQIENPAFVISAQVYEWSTIRVKDGIDEGKDLNQTTFGGAPSLAAGTFTVPFLKKSKFAYSYLTRSRTEMNFFVRVDEEGELINSIPGNVILNGKLKYANNFKDDWLGLTWSRPINEKLSVGVSNFISILNKSSEIDINLNALGENGQNASLMMGRQYSYKSGGLLWKLGMALDLEPVRIGMTVTTPKVNVRGEGSYIIEDYLIGVDTTGDGVNDDVYIFNLQEDLKSATKSPWAIGLGVGIHLKKLTIHLSGEWYDKVPYYTIMETDPFIAQDTGDTLKFTLVDDLNAVLNYGLGLEVPLSEKVNFYASIATDHSSVKSNIFALATFDEEASNSVFQADYYKFGAGFSLSAKWADITLGATYTGASQQIARPVNFPDESDDPIFNSGKNSELIFTQWRFILGFSFPFADKIKDGIGAEPEK